MVIQITSDFVMAPPILRSRRHALTRMPGAPPCRDGKRKIPAMTRGRAQNNVAYRGLMSSAILDRTGRGVGGIVARQ
jgi:hypothetical protein